MGFNSNEWGCGYPSSKAQVQEDSETGRQTAPFRKVKNFIIVLLHFTSEKGLKHNKEQISSVFRRRVTQGV